jgi:hypothetical protein
MRDDANGPALRGERKRASGFFISILQHAVLETLADARLIKSAERRKMTLRIIFH